MELVWFLDKKSLKQGIGSADRRHAPLEELGLCRALDGDYRLHVAVYENR